MDEATGLSEHFAWSKGYCEDTRDRFFRLVG